MCDGRCDCLVASGRLAVTVANHSIWVFFLTTIAHHIEIQMYMALGNIPLELKPHPLCVGYVTSLVICLWLIICCTRLGAYKPNWVSCSFCHILLMMISVLYFLRYCHYSCLFSAIELLDNTSRPFHVNGIWHSMAQWPWSSLAEAVAHGLMVISRYCLRHRWHLMKKIWRTSYWGYHELFMHSYM